MNRIKLLLITAAVMFISSCNEFTRDIQRIDGEFPLSLGFEFGAVDIAPGDTVSLRSYWNGTPKITPADLTWEVSWKFFLDPYGEEVILERESLNPYIVGAISELPSNSRTQIFEMKIAIPEDIIVESPGIPQNLSPIISSLNIDPSSLGISLSKENVLHLLDSLSALSSVQQAAISSDEGAVINGISQLSTAMFRIFCDNTRAGGFKTQVDHSARYHSKLQSIPGVFVNHNPVVTSRRIIEVKGDQKVLDNSSTIVSTIDIAGDSVVIDYDENNSYFLEETYQERDSVISVNESFTGHNYSFEEFIRFNSYDEDGFETIAFEQQDDQPYRFEGVPVTISKLFVEEENPVMNKPFWVRMVTTDYRQGTSSRPSGFALTELVVTLK